MAEICLGKGDDGFPGFPDVEDSARLCRLPGSGERGRRRRFIHDNMLRGVICRRIPRCILTVQFNHMRSLPERKCADPGPCRRSRAPSHLFRDIRAVVRQSDIRGVKIFLRNGKCQLCRIPVIEIDVRPALRLVIGNIRKRTCVRRKCGSAHPFSVFHRFQSRGRIVYHDCLSVRVYCRLISRRILRRKKDISPKRVGYLKGVTVCSVCSLLYICHHGPPCGIIRLSRVIRKTFDA